MALGVGVAGGVPGPGGGGIPVCTEVDHHPPANRMTNGCKNITLPQTSFAGGNYALTQGDWI